MLPRPLDDVGTAAGERDNLLNGRHSTPHKGSLEFQRAEKRQPSIHEVAKPFMCGLGSHAKAYTDIGPGATVCPKPRNSVFPQFFGGSFHVGQVPQTFGRARRLAGVNKRVRINAERLRKAENTYRSAVFALFISSEPTISGLHAIRHFFHILQRIGRANNTHQNHVQATTFTNIYQP